MSSLIERVDPNCQQIRLKDVEFVLLLVLPCSFGVDAQGEITASSHHQILKGIDTPNLLSVGVQLRIEVIVEHILNKFQIPWIRKEREVEGTQLMSGISFVKNNFKT